MAIAAWRAQEDKEVYRHGKHAAEFEPPARKEAIQKGRLILVAEDNETNQKVIWRQLGLLGYAADIVASGTLALRRWQSENYALLLTDLHMPDMDGYGLASR